MSYQAYAEWRSGQEAAGVDVLWGDPEREFPGVDRVELAAWGNDWLASQPRRLIDYGTPVHYPEGP